MRTSQYTIKNKQAKHKHHPEGVKESMAEYYADLYMKKPVSYHPQLDIIRAKFQEMDQNRE